MKIFIVSPTLTNGGAERVASMLAKGFSERGHEVTIVTHTNQKISYDPGPKVKLLPIAFEKRKRLFKWFGAVRLIHGYFKKDKPEVAIGIMWFCSYLARMAAIGTKTKVILTEHSAFERFKGYPLDPELRITRKWIDYRFHFLTVLTEQDKDVGGKKYAHATVMPNPLTFPTYEGKIADLRKKKQVLAVGRIYNWYVKGFDVLLEAWGKITQKADFNPEWKLRIAGDGTTEDLNYLTNLCKRYRIENTVEFLGFCDDMLNLYREAEIFCLSSRSEGMPMSLLESMGQGCAPVATDYKGRTKNIITDDNVGVLCIPQDSESLASGLWKMMTDEKYRKIVQQNARDCSRYYSLDNVMGLWEDMLNKIGRKYAKQ